MDGRFVSLPDAAAKDPQVRATLTETAAAAENELIKPLFEFHNNGQPVGNGWEHLFEPNRLTRFSLGTKSKSMTRNSDGSLTLYFQHESPGADKETNWVPTPADAFSLYIRAYWPKEEVLNGSWMPPMVVPAS